MNGSARLTTRLGLNWKETLQNVLRGSSRSCRNPERRLLVWSDCELPPGVVVEILRDDERSFALSVRKKAGGAVPYDSVVNGQSPGKLFWSSTMAAHASPLGRSSAITALPFVRKAGPSRSFPWMSATAQAE
jgi:hypothetical protein